MNKNNTTQKFRSLRQYWFPKFYNFWGWFIGLGAAALYVNWNTPKHGIGVRAACMIWFFAMLWAFYHFRKQIILSDDGISIHNTFSSQFFSWQDIQAARIKDNEKDVETLDLFVGQEIQDFTIRMFDIGLLEDGIIGYIGEENFGFDALRRAANKNIPELFSSETDPAFNVQGLTGVFSFVLPLLFIGFWGYLVFILLRSNGSRMGLVVCGFFTLAGIYILISVVGYIEVTAETVSVRRVFGKYEMAWDKVESFEQDAFLRCVFSGHGKQLVFPGVLFNQRSYGVSLGEFFLQQIESRKIRIGMLTSNDSRSNKNTRV